MRIIERNPVRLVNAVLRSLRQEVKDRYQLRAAETSSEDYEEIYDAIIGARLDPSLFAKARNDEMRFLVDQLGVSKYDSVDNCLKTAGKRPIPVKCARK